MADMSAADRRQAMSQGDAIKNASGKPSFPIENKADLADAIRAVGRVKPDTDAARARVRRFIIARAKALGASDAIPATWNSDGSLKG